MNTLIPVLPYGVTHFEASYSELDVHQVSLSVSYTTA
jgi:hypothetical protein